MTPQRGFTGDPNSLWSNFLVDVLRQRGMPSDFASRKILAEERGIVGDREQYTGSAQQNIQLLDSLNRDGRSEEQETRSRAPLKHPQQLWEEAEAEQRPARDVDIIDQKQHGKVGLSKEKLDNFVFDSHNEIEDLVETIKDNVEDPVIQNILIQPSEHYY